MKQASKVFPHYSTHYHSDFDDSKHCIEPESHFLYSCLTVCFYHVTYAFSVSESTLCECVNVFKNSMLFWFCLCFLSLVLLFLLLFLVSKSFLMVKGHLEAKGKVLSNLQAEWNCLENFLVYFDLMDGDKRVYHDFGNSVLK